MQENKTNRKIFKKLNANMIKSLIPIKMRIHPKLSICGRKSAFDLNLYIYCIPKGNLDID